MSEIIITKEEHKLNDYENNSDLIYNLSKMAKYFEYEDKKDKLLSILIEK